MLFICYKISSSFKEDGLIIPLRGQLEIIMEKPNEGVLYLKYKVKSEWIYKKHTVINF